jgi:hypothetical protein
MNRIASHNGDWEHKNVKTDGRPATTVTKTVPATSGLSATARNSKSASENAIYIMYISNRRDASNTRAELPAVGKSTITGIPI